MPYTIYHNPQCSTSRKALALLKDHGIEPVVVQYLKDVPSEMELAELVAKLGIKPEELVRKKEALYKEQYAGKKLSDREWIKALHEHPRLIERPIVVKGNTAVIGRPVEQVEALLK